MTGYSATELAQTPEALSSLLGKCRKAQDGGLGAPQATLMARRIAALAVAPALVDREIGA